MRYFNKLFPRYFASSRLNSTPKPSRSDLNYKEANPITSPYEVIDGNICGLEHRLSLYEMLRLKEQIKLDEFELLSIASENIPFPNQNIEKNLHYVELSYKILSNFPGLNCPTDSFLDSVLELRFPISNLDLSPLEVIKLLKLMNLSSNDKFIEFKVADFPFLSQNKIKALDILNALILFAKTKTSTANEFFKTEVKSKAKLENSNRCLNFPSNWL